MSCRMRSRTPACTCGSPPPRADAEPSVRERAISHPWPRASARSIVRPEVNDIPHAPRLTSDPVFRMPRSRRRSIARSALAARGETALTAAT